MNRTRPTPHFGTPPKGLRALLFACLSLLLVASCSEVSNALVDPGTSSATILPESSFYADGEPGVWVEVVLRTRSGAPVGNTPVSFAATGFDNLLLEPSATDGDGRTLARIGSTLAELKTLSFQAHGADGTHELDDHPTVQFVADPRSLSASLSTVSVSPSQSILPNALDEATISVRLYDAHGNALEDQIVQISVSGSNNSVTQPFATTDATGLTTGFVSSTLAEGKTVTITANPGADAVVLDTQPVVTFVGDATTISPLVSTVVATPTTGLIADGVQTSAVTVTVRDGYGNPVPALSVQLAGSGTNNVVAPGLVTTDAGGVALFTFASTTAELKTLVGTINPGAGQVVITQQPTLSFLGDPSTIDATLSTVTALPATGVVADGAATSAVNVVVLDVNSNPVGGQLVALASDGTDDTLTPATQTTDAAGLASFTIATTRAELKTLTATINPGASQVIATQQPTVEFIADASTISASLSTASASPASGVVADGAASSTISVTVVDANSNPVPGQTVQLASTGTGNTLSPATVITDIAGVASFSLASIQAESKTLTATVNPGAGQVVITQQPSVGFIGDASSISATNSGVLASPASGVVADGSASSTISVVVRDANSNPVAGQTVDVSAAGVGAVLSPTSTTTNAAGLATFSLTSTKSGAKTVSAVVNPGGSAVNISQQATVGFVGDPSTIDAGLSGASASPATGVVADGATASAVTVTVLDANSNPVGGQTVQLAASGTSNTLTPSSATTDASGVASFTIASTKAETKTLTATVNPGAGQVVITQQPTIEFIADVSTISASLSSASASPTSGVVADDVDTSTITVTVHDANSNAVSGQTVQLASSGTNNSLTPSSTTTNASGVASFTIATTKAESKTLTATVNPGASQVVLTQQPTVAFIGDATTISATLSGVVGSPTSGIVADGSASSTISITVLDANSNPVAGQTVDVSALGSGALLSPTSVTSDANGAASFALTSTKSGTKTVSAQVNPGASVVTITQQASITFVADASTIDAGLSSAIASPSTGVVADGTTTSAVTVTVLDANSNPVSGQTVQLAASGTNNTLTPSSTTTNASGVASFTIASTKAETKTLTATVNPGAGQVVITQQPTVEFIADVSTISASSSTVVASPTNGVLADGSTASTISVTVVDANSNPVPSQTVDVSASGLGASLSPTSSTTNASGVATFSLTATKSGGKTVSAVVDPSGAAVSITQQATVGFVADPASVSASLTTVVVDEAWGTEADGVESVTVTVTVRDSDGDPMVGMTVALAASGTGNALTQPAAVTNGSGQATGTLASTTAETKNLVATINPGAQAVVPTQQPDAAFSWSSSDVYYVRTTGDDGAAGTSPNSAWASLTQAAASVIAGDIVHVGAGSYGSITLSTSGTSSAPIRLIADTDGARTGDAGAVIIDALGSAFAVDLDGASFVELEGFTLIGASNVSSPTAGVVVSGSDVLLRDCELYGNSNGVWIEGDTRWLHPYAHRQLISFGTDHSALPLNYTVSISMDTRAASTNVSLTSGDDVRIAWQPTAGGPIELDRIGDTWNAASTSIEFRLQSAISANADQDADGAYYVYYGDASASTPPSDEGEVYYFADFFDRPDSAVLGNGWSEMETGGDFAIVSGALVIYPSGDSDPPQLIASQALPLGSLSSDFTVSLSWNMPPNGESIWSFWGVNIGDAASMVDSNRLTGVGVGLYNAESLGVSTAQVMTNDHSNELETGIGGAHTFELAVDVAAETYDYWRDGGLITSNVPFTNSVAALDRVRFGADNFGYAPGEEQTIDDYKIVLDVANAPEESLGSEEAPPVDNGDRVVLESCKISGNSGDGDGVLVINGADVELRNNLIYDNAGHGVLVQAVSRGLELRSNTLYLNVDDQVAINAEANEVVLIDNVVSAGLADGLALASGSSATSSYDLVWGHGGADYSGLSAGTGDLNVDPQLVDPDGADNLLGGAQASDDSFHLAVGPPGPASDAGSANAVTHTLADGTSFADLTTSIDETLDGEGSDGAQLNLGHHYAPNLASLGTLSADDGRLSYSRGSERTPKLRDWQDGGSSWSSELEGPSSGSTLTWSVLTLSPLLNDEELALLLCDDGSSTELDLLHWDGGRWERETLTTAITSANSDKRGFDAVYEQNSGEALVVYSDASATPVYRTRSGGRWSVAQPLPLNDGGGADPDPNSGAVLWIQLEARPGTDEVALAYLDANFDLVAMVWDGAQWLGATASALELDTAYNGTTGEAHNRAFDLAYESISGDLFVAWSRDSASGCYYATKAAASTSFAAPISISPSGASATHYVDLAAESAGDRIALLAHDIGGGNERLLLATWSGTTVLDATIADSQTRNVSDTSTGDLAGAVSWLGSSGEAVCVYPDNQSATLDWISWSSGSGWVQQADVAVGSKGYTESVVIAPFPGRAEVLVVVSDSNSALWALTYDGATWTVTNSGAALESALSSVSSAPFDVDLK